MCRHEGSDWIAPGAQSLPSAAFCKLTSQSYILITDLESVFTRTCHYQCPQDFRYYPSIRLEGLIRTTNASDKIPGIREESQTRHFPNTKRKWHGSWRYLSFLRGTLLQILIQHKCAYKLMFFKISFTHRCAIFRFRYFFKEFQFLACNILYIHSYSFQKSGGGGVVEMHSILPRPAPMRSATHSAGMFGCISLKTTVLRPK